MSEEKALAPHDLECEAAVLACILSDNGLLPFVAGILSASDFFLVRHAWLFDAMAALHERAEAIDVLSLRDQLGPRFDECGGIAYLLRLSNDLPTSLAWQTYAQVVQRLSARRKLLAAASELGKVAMTDGVEMEQLASDAESCVLRVTSSMRPRKIEPAVRRINALIDEIETRSTSGEKFTGLPTGFTDLDNVLKGLRPGNLYTFGGRPGLGKTTFMINAARNLLADGRSVAFFSLEMSESDILNKFIACEGRLDSEALQLGQLRTDEQWRALTNAQAAMQDWRLFTDDKAGITPRYIVNRCESIAAQYGLDAIFVDYLQLMRSGQRNDNRVAEVSEISRSLQEASRLLNVPVIAAAQLNRGLESRNDKRPMLSDLRESGSIEQDSAVVVFLYRDDAYNASSDKPNQTELIVAKNRHGKTGAAHVLFNGAQSRFASMTTHRVSVA